MKKLLLSILSMAICLGAGAASLRLTPASASQRHLNPTSAVSFGPSLLAPADLAPAKAEGETESVNFTLAGEPYSAYGFRNCAKGNQIAQAFCIAPDVADLYAGSQITAVDFYTGGNPQTQNNKVRLYTAFITKSLQENPVVTKGVMASNATFSHTTVTFNEPYTIQAGEELYVGIYCTLTDAYDYTLVADGLEYPATDIDGCWVAVRTTADGSNFGTYEWNSYTSQFGNLCIGCTISGDNLPSDLASLDAMEINPIVKANEPFDILFQFTNKSNAPISSLEYEYTIADAAPVTGTATFTEPVAYNKPTVCSFQAQYPVADRNAVPVKLTITKVNGTENKQPNNSAQTSTIFIPMGSGYIRNVLCEEVTSIWCQYCPIGYCGMRDAREAVTDGSLAIASVHTKFGGRVDPMQTTSYADLYNVMTSLPSSLINRRWDVYPGYEYLMQYYEMIHSIPAIVDLDIQCDWVDDTKKAVKVDSKFISIYDEENAPYRLVYIVTEDGVGPYSQVNGIGGEAGYPPFSGAGTSVSVLFDDVARLCDTYKGIAGSIPATIERYTEYDYSHDVTLPTTIKNTDKIAIIVGIVNTATGEIENVKFMRAPQFGTGFSGIDAPVVSEADSDAPVEFYNLQGVRVANPSNGIYIRRQGNTVTKVIL